MRRNKTAFGLFCINNEGRGGGGGGGEGVEIPLKSNKMLYRDRHVGMDSRDVIFCNSLAKMWRITPSVHAVFLY